MVEQSAVITHNLVLEMNKQDLTNMTSRLEPGGCVVAGVIRPGQALTMFRTGPGDDYHYLIAGGSNTNAKLAFRIRHENGSVVKEAKASEAGDRIYTTARETHNSTAKWNYEVVNTATSGDPVVATMMLTRSGTKGLTYKIGDLYKAFVSLSKQVKDMTDENWGMFPGQAAITGTLVAPGTALTMGPYNMQQHTFVLVGSDDQNKSWDLFLMKPNSETVFESDTDTKDEPFADLQGQSAVNIRVKNSGEKASFMAYAVMRTP